MIAPLDPILAVLEAAGREPWTLEAHSVHIRSGNGQPIDGYRDDIQPHREAIVRAVNTFAGAREALRDCIEALTRLPNVDGAYRVTVLQEARAALAAMEGSNDRETTGG